MRITALFLCAMLLAAFAAPSASAQIIGDHTQYLDPVDSDYAPKMSSCTSTYGCKECVETTFGVNKCATMIASNGYCKCTAASDGSSCISSGSCTYKR